MRAGLSTIQQTLTAEAANVLNQSIADAARRNHGQTTPLHVAATLLAAPTGYLRQACIRSHPNSSHPLQCRALELCFTVALERLPTTTAAAGEPPINNALMAALKRAQAHQRRGCPENQQQPLLAVKVELEQLIISILDDPSVSRVMREASFSSPAVKATIEQSLAASPPPAVATVAIGPGPIAGLRLRPSLSPAPPQVGRNLYLNPRLQSAGAASDQSSAARRREDVRKVVEVLLRSKKRNPVIVGDAEPEAVARELLQMIESKEIAEAPLRNLQVVSLDKEFGSDRAQIQGKMKALEGVIDARIGSGVILDLGDLKWLVEQPSSRFAGGPIQPPPQQQHLVSDTGRAVVAEMAKLLAKYAGGEEAAAQRLWVMGTATCETYLRCQVYHPSMENDWDLQAVPIAARAPIAGVFPRFTLFLLPPLLSLSECQLICHPWNNIGSLRMSNFAGLVGTRCWAARRRPGSPVRRRSGGSRRMQSRSSARHAPRTTTRRWPSSAPRKSRRSWHGLLFPSGCRWRSSGRRNQWRRRR